MVEIKRSGLLSEFSDNIDIVIQNLWQYIIQWEIDHGHRQVIFYINGYVVDNTKKGILSTFLKAYLYDNRKLIFESINVDDAFDYDIAFDQPGVKEGRELLNSLASCMVMNTPLKQFVLAYINGYAFCEKLDISPVKNIALIHLLFVTPQGFETLYEHISNGPKNFICLIGEPQSGKTYTSYFILYKLYIEKSSKFNIFKCNNLLEFKSILSKLHYYKDKCFIYYDDPFGYSGFYADSVRETIIELAKAREIPNLKIIITSRSALFVSGITKAKEIYKKNIQLFDQSIFVYFHFKDIFQEYIIDDELEEKTRHIVYSPKNIKDIIEKIALLFNAKWVSDYSLYVNEGEYEMNWDLIDYNLFSPGNIYSSFVVNPYLKDLAKENIQSIINGLVSGPLNLARAFSAEVNAFNNAFNNYADRFAIQLFCVLPAITVITNDRDIKNIFYDPKDLETVKPYFELLKTSDRSPFSAPAKVYFHPMFGKAIDEYLYNHGFEEFVASKEFVDFVRKGHEKIDKKFIRDFLYFYFYLDYLRIIQDDHSREHLAALLSDRKLVIEELKKTPFDKNTKNQINIVQFFYTSIQNPKVSLPDKKIAEFINQLSMQQDITSISYIGSVLEHQIYLSIKYSRETRRNERISLTVSAFIKAIANLILNPESDVRITQKILAVFIHSIFSNLEEVIDYDEDEISKNIIYKTLNTAISNIVKSYKSSKSPALLDTSIIFIDAIIMKFSEMYQYATENAMAIKRLNDIDPQIEVTRMSADNQRCNQLMEIFRELFLDFWNRLDVSDESADYLKGAVTFTLMWHNRWCFDDGYTEFVNWLEEKDLLAPISKFSNQRFLEGFLYNAAYHHQYFLLRADAWNRENLIMIWRKSNPRRGANALYESGILYKSEREHKANDKIDELMILETVLRELIRNNDKDRLNSLLYLIGLRYEKNQEFYQPLVEIIKNQKSTIAFNDVSKDLEKCQLTLLKTELKI